jgi:hypothetical protein
MQRQLIGHNSLHNTVVACVQDRKSKAHDTYKSAPTYTENGRTKTKKTKLRGL